MSDLRRKAVVLLSGGLDSATTLAIARDAGYDCYALSLSYGQRHAAELAAAKRVASAMGVSRHLVLPMALDLIGGSALTDSSIHVPEKESPGIPVTYVPARNTVFLSLALGWAEVLGAWDLFIGVNAVDYSGYPHCRPAFIQAMTAAANLGTRFADEERRLIIHTPLENLSKAQIIRKGLELGVDYSLTTTCYNPLVDGNPCGKCDACKLRRRGFLDAGSLDPLPYPDEN